MKGKIETYSLVKTKNGRFIYQVLNVFTYEGNRNITVLK